MKRRSAEEIRAERERKTAETIGRKVMKIIEDNFRAMGDPRFGRAIPPGGVEFYVGYRKSKVVVNVGSWRWGR